ncbi:NAD-P-binding protein [Calocera viscosa TUFC12733]|uniref:NAD-P-binding protein n=1 Tax=Calocera viscosa (strain TUFC12733) TaxID=1330018 RepID=A0A167HRE4_CALVF|nr:NAD-P-binding protein [Calocera viscosa TUFC12733]
MPRFNPINDIPDLTGRIALVTGANSGLGYQTVQQLANHGAKVYLTTRSEAKALDTIRRLEEANPALKDTGRLQYLVIDFSLVTSAKAGAEEFLRKESRLDILVNNAGIVGEDFELTKEGLSITFATDHVSAFAFTNTLLPLLEATAKQPGADVRLITISSVAHSSALKTTKFDSIDDFRDKCSPEAKVNSMGAIFARYGQAKLANILFASELQRRLDAAGMPIISISVHPGGVATEGFERAIRSFGFGFLWPIFSWFLLSPLQGATTQLFAATSPEIRRDVDTYKGRYLIPYGKVAPEGKMSNLAKSPVLAGQLWGMTERVVGDILEKGSVPRVPPKLQHGPEDPRTGFRGKGPAKLRTEL